METTPTTVLEAVNIMLSGIREAPVNSLASGLIDAELAETTLYATSRSIQSVGYHFNTEYKYDIAPSVDGYIILPAEFIKADLSSFETQRRSGTNEYVQRGNRMYDVIEHTYNIGETLSLDIVTLLDFDLLPEDCRRYVALRAARVFQERVLGSGTISDFQRKDELEAKIDFQNNLSDAADYNIFDNVDVNRSISRYNI